MYLEVRGVDKIVGPPFSLVLGYSSFSPFLPSSHVFLYDLIHAVNNTLWTSEATPQGHTEHSRMYPPEEPDDLRVQLW